ncbi:hypothetical protein CAAN1_01S11936 [[Candida] anglica]|uniref:Uncharacterized protein n=1 Tax=[Candida] anglica TaxID=148631 RepID=A0ABP0ELR0_9ASCO
MEGNYQLDNLRIVKSIIDIGSHISNMLSKSLVELTLCGDTSNDIPEFPSFENLRKLNLQGNPINLLMHFPNLEGLKSLSLTFEGDPTTFNFTPPCFPMDTVEEFQLRFNSTYICKERPTLLLEINTFLESLEFPNLRGLSISSTDLRRGNSFKSILPAFNEFIFKVPYLSALHLSIGCEINFSHLKSILRHKNSLTRLVWIGNLDGNMFDKYRNIKKIRFDMVNGILLNSITDKYSLGESELLYVDCMCDLGKERGDNYFDLESFKICYGESQVNSKLVEYITKEIQTFIDEFKNLRYMVINGIHFNVLPTFDNHCEITSVYD